MQNLYDKYKSIIHSFINITDISILLKDPLKSNFEINSLQKIEQQQKVEVFFEEFDKVKSECKYLNFIEVSKDISDWIAEFLLAEDNGIYADTKLKIVCNMINTQPEFYVENLTFDKTIIRECLDTGIISESNYKILINLLEKEGLMFTKWKFLDIVHVKSYNCYFKFLYFSYKYNKAFVELFCNQLLDMLDGSIDDEDIRNTIQVYSNSIISDYIGDDDSGRPSIAYMESQVTYNVPVGRAESIFHSNVNDKSISSSTVPTFTTNQSRPSNNNSKLDISDNSDNSDDEDIDFSNLFGEVKNKEVRDILNFQPDKSTESDTLNIRTYQQELADHGIKGQNVLICAPTGSGKTIVAIKIVEEHLKSNLGAKIVFIVPTNSLVEQQYRKFHKYLKNRRIICQSGDTKPGNIPLSFQIQNNEIFVLTSDIFKNMLDNYEENKKSINDFTMVIFDECHHCLKGHSYNKLMDFYFKAKEKDSCVPQIIGMTASTGTDKASNMETAMKTLYQLCANLDCKIVATVKQNLENLKANLKVAKEEILLPGCREFDYFEDNLWNFMVSTENHIKTLLAKKKIKISIPEDKWHDKYLNFLSDLLNLDSKLESDEISREIRNLAKYLGTLYRALLINNLFTGQRSCELIKTLQNDNPLDFEKHIQSQLKEFLSNSNLDQDENPSMKRLKSEISDQLKNDKKSRIIIFVKEVSYAKIMEQELNNANVDNLNCLYFVGTNKSAEKGGSTSSAINDTLTKFEKGLINVICCTSVAEEGIDIERCNLVIRYGTVTNETSRIQTRGRARAEDSRYLIIIPDKFQWMARKEIINKYRESMMYKAIENVQKLRADEMSKKIDELQLIRQILLGSIEDNETRVEPNNSSDLLSIHCDKCERYLCDVSDIRLLRGNSYVVINKKKFSNLPVKELLKNTSQVICVECKSQVGITQKHNGIPLPVLQLKKIMFKSKDNACKRFHKWKDTQVKVPDATEDDLLDANNTQYRS